jgi:hypothetical protein
MGSGGVAPLFLTSALDGVIPMHDTQSYLPSSAMLLQASLPSVLYNHNKLQQRRLVPRSGRWEKYIFVCVCFLYRKGP